jgi:hypothetical protein
VAITETPPPPAPALGLPARTAREKGSRTRRKVGLRAGTLESLAVFLVAYVVYLGIGYQLTIVQHLTVFDALARLAHGYFVWWNDPAKLAAIGFVWAPVSTLVFLPFTLIKPLATSLMALPATSGLFTAVTLAFLMGGLRDFGVRWWARLGIVICFGLNPLVVFYAINGMSEAAFMSLLTVGVVLFIRWYRTGAVHQLPLSAVFITLAALCRYELMLFALLLSLAVPVTLMVRRRRPLEVEGSWLIYLVPLVYGIGMWAFFNWLILGDPLFWLQQQVGGGDGNSTVAGTVGGAATGTTLGPQAPAASHGPLGVIVEVIELNWRIFPPLVLAPPVLVVVALMRRTRSLLPIWIGVLCVLNAATTTLWYLASHGDNLLQLRYNMRGMTIAVIALGLLLSAVPDRFRTPASVLAVLAVAASIPVSWATMRDYPYQYLEKVFVQAVSTGDDVQDASTAGAYTVGVADDREMGDFINAHVPRGRRVILTDDAQCFGVMLTSGRPREFWDRIDLGDEKWTKAADNPYGKVHYLLVARYPLPPFEIIDEIQKHYPSMRLTQIPGVSVEHANSHYALLRIAPRRPRTGSRFDDMVDAIAAGRTPRL